LARWQREPPPENDPPRPQARAAEAARRLFAMSQPIAGTLAESYLRNRGIDPACDEGALRFHPRCFYRPDESLPVETWPALIVPVTDLEGRITGVQRTWLDPDGFDTRRLGKAPIETPRRAMGDVLGNAVRFGIASDVLAAGEGIETVLSLRTVLPMLPIVAALSANHLAVFRWPATLRRLYVAVDADAAGKEADRALAARATSAGIEAIALWPGLKDFNEDLRSFGPDGLRESLQTQIVPEDFARFVRAMPLDAA
ncbi:MAG: toprim domain-containing protein, partial [Bradyrhizobium sp.]|uniref:DUF7146 domain-containing protein n=1 Tax=Bradyrhizobium sp. TaxID=376 RepID=UPI001D8F7407